MEFSNNIGSFITECINFKYSAESYEIDKLTKEIELCDHYIESLLFANENASDIQSGILSFNEGFFFDDAKTIITEAESTNSIQVYKQSSIQTAEQQLEEKENKLNNKILNGLIAFFGKIGRFFMRVASKFLITDEMEKLITAINNTTLSKEDLQKIVSIYENQSTKWNFTILTYNSGATYKNGTKYSMVTPRFKDENDKDLIKLTTAVIRMTLNDKISIIPKNGIDMVSPDQLLDISIRMKDNIKIGDRKDLKKEIDDYFNQSREKGISFNINNTDLMSVSKEIEIIKSQFEELQSNNKLFLGIKKSQTLGKCYTKMIGAAGNLMSAITSIAQFRKDMIPVLQGIVNNYSITNKNKTE